MMTDENEELYKEYQKKEMMRKIIMFALLFVVILPGVFFSGAATSCVLGGGSLSGVKCKDIDVVSVCEHEGNLYQIIAINETTGKEIETG